MSPTTIEVRDERPLGFQVPSRSSVASGGEREMDTAGVGQATRSSPVTSYCYTKHVTIRLVTAS